MEGIEVLSLKSDSMRRPCSPLSSTVLQPDGSNLPLVVRQLKKYYPEVYEDWLVHLRTALPDLAAVEVLERPEDRSLYLRARYANGAEVPSWLVSDGTLRLMALTLIGYLPESERIILIEEAENGIHPKAIETMFQALSSAYGKQVLMATHSPVILSIAKAHQVLCFRKDQEGATRVISGAEHPALRAWQGEENLGVLYASGVLD